MNKSELHIHAVGMSCEILELQYTILCYRSLEHLIHQWQYIGKGHQLSHHEHLHLINVIIYFKNNFHTFLPCHQTSFWSLKCYFFTFISFEQQQIIGKSVMKTRCHAYSQMGAYQSFTSYNIIFKTWPERVLCWIVCGLVWVLMHLLQKNSCGGSKDSNFLLCMPDVNCRASGVLVVQKADVW